MSLSVSGRNAGAFAGRTSISNREKKRMAEKTRTVSVSICKNVMRRKIIGGNNLKTLRIFPKPMVMTKTHYIALKERRFDPVQRS